MPTRKARTIAPSRVILRVTELERRDTPAWWAVSAPVPAEGTPGSTDATHTGTLTLNPDYAAVNGTVTVFADTAAHAAAKALVGTVTVTLLGESIDYAFGPDTVGTSAADHKAFVAVATGSAVEIGFEDMAGFAGSDWDYNDRTWSGVSVAGAPETVVARLDDQVWPCAQVSGESATVTSVVTVVEVDSKPAYKWWYEVNNGSVDWGSPQYADVPQGLAGLIINDDVPDAPTMVDPGNDWGWSNNVGMFMGNDHAASWLAPDLGENGGHVYVGDTAHFWYFTEPRPVITGQGQYFSPSLAGGGVGAALVPDKPAVPLKAALQTVTFSGANYFDVVADPGDAAYAAKPHWNDPDTDGIINAVGVDHQLPVGYVRGDVPMVSATFALKSVDPAAKTALVRADGPGEYDLDWTVATIAGNVLTLPATALMKPLKNEVDHIRPATFVWEVCTSLPAKDASAAGKSANEMFVILAVPTPVNSSSLGAVAGGAMSVWPTMYVTPLWLFCKSAKGTTDADAATKATFANGYAGTSVTTHPDIDPLYNDPALPIHYYKNWLNNNTSFVTMLTTAVKDGQCAAWVDLFKRTLGEGGVDESLAARYQINNAKSDKPSYLMVKHWVYTANNAGYDAFLKNVNTLKPANQAAAIRAGFFVIGFALKINAERTAEGQATADDFTWGTSGAIDARGVKGQNNLNPLSLFNSHMVVKIGDTIYDPSYGTTSAWANDQAAWYQQSIAGYAIMEQLADGTYVLRSGRIENARLGLYDTYFDWKFTAVPNTAP